MVSETATCEVELFSFNTSNNSVNAKSSLFMESRSSCNISTFLVDVIASNFKLSRADCLSASLTCESYIKQVIRFLAATDRDYRQCRYDLKMDILFSLKFEEKMLMEVKDDVKYYKVGTQ